MKNNLLTFLLALLAFAAMPTASRGQFNWPYKIVDGTIVTDVPERAEGQQNVLNLTTPKLPVVRVGFVGLGMRGSDAVRRWTYLNGIQVMALCDHERERAETCNNILREASMPAADVYSGAEGYRQLCERKDIDLVYIATDWNHHFPVAKYAMEHGKHVAIEVPSAMNLHEIWALINLSERTRLHCMMLENCCYDFFELNSLNMSQKGMFGEVLYVTGAYRHDLAPYWDEYWKKDAQDKLGWRLTYNKTFRGDIYPTHGLGPIAQVLNIHRGDRMKTLVAMDTKAVNGPAKVREDLGYDGGEFRNGDHTTTLIRTELGKVIEVQHNTVCPQPYSRMYQLVGTRGFANKYPVEGYSLTKDKMQEAGLTIPERYAPGHQFLPKDLKQAFEAAYESPLVKRYEQEAKEVGGHGGMDFIMDSRLVYCLHHGLPLDMDVYDLAEWCCLAELGSISMDHGNMSVAVPDFTRGYWSVNRSYRHAFASEADEAAVNKASAEFTARLKAKGKLVYSNKNKQDFRR